MKILARPARPATICVMGALLPMILGGNVAAQAAPPPALEVVAASSEVTSVHYEGIPWMDLNLGIYLIAPGAPFEVQVKRKSYNDPIIATQLIRQGGHTQEKQLPKGLLKSFSGFPNFLHVTLLDDKGKKVVDRDQPVCPIVESARMRPDGPSDSPYPIACADIPWALGSIWRLQHGWGVNATSWGHGAPTVDLPDGKYSATVNVTKTYQRLFGLSGSPKHITVNVRTEPMDAAAKRTPATLKAAPKPQGPQSVPAGPKPDLRSLPAWGMAIDQSSPTRAYLQFAATIWNAGQSPLVVDGFRVNQNLMDAYQYFYNAKGDQIGYVKSGSMEWDARAGHEHWHFKDFASYRLLGPDGKEVVRSQKESFCLAPTDPINMLMKNANWKPLNTDLHSACGDLAALSTREVLDIGSGDTYLQYLPGQSFDISDLKNGTYYVQLIANPEHRLTESDLKNNESKRKVILGGTPEHRTVKVPPVGMVDG